MTRRRRLRRRLFWAGVLLGLVLLCGTTAALRACSWCLDTAVESWDRLRWQLRAGFYRQGSRRRTTGGSMYARLSLATVVAATVTALAAPAAWGDPWGADRQAATAQDAKEPAWKIGLMARSDALNRYYGLGTYAGTRTKSIRRADVPAWEKALTARSDALNRYYRLGAYAGK